MCPSDPQSWRAGAFTQLILCFKRGSFYGRNGRKSTALSVNADGSCLALEKSVRRSFGRPVKWPGEHKVNNQLSNWWRCIFRHAESESSLFLNGQTQRVACVFSRWTSTKSTQVNRFVPNAALYFCKKPAKRSIFLQRWGCTIWCKNWKANGIQWGNQDLRVDSASFILDTPRSIIIYIGSASDTRPPKKGWGLKWTLPQYLTLKLYILDDHIWLYIILWLFQRFANIFCGSFVQISIYSPILITFSDADIHEFPSQATSVSTAVCDQWPKPSWGALQREESFNGHKYHQISFLNLKKWQRNWETNHQIFPFVQILLFPKRRWSKRVLIDIIKTKLSKIACHSASVHYWILLRFAGLSSRFESNVLLEYWMTIAYT